VTAIALPDPQSMTLARVPEIVLQAQSLRERIESDGDADTALELHRRLEAMEKYLSDKDAAQTIAGESRLTEALIGRLLGPAPGYGHPEKSNFDSLHPHYRRDFRVLGEHEEEIKTLVAEGVVKRAALLRAVNGHNPAPRMEPCPTCGRAMRADRPARGGAR
jgi:hypothetical protein